jgi:hypothetical protein
MRRHALLTFFHFFDSFNGLYYPLVAGTEITPLCRNQLELTKPTNHALSSKTVATRREASPKEAVLARFLFLNLLPIVMRP